MAQLSKVVKWNKENQQMEQTDISREKGENILRYVDYSKLCYVITYFTELNQVFGRENITFSISLSSRAIEWINKHLFEL